MDTFTNEIDLLNASLSGNKEAFGTIVENYQSLVCSITYSATGDFAKSEELAQETFIRAWKELKQLKDLGKFRAWLCTITRNLLRQSIKKQNKDIIDTAQPIENAAASETSETRPDQIAISKEQQIVIWQALQEIPETYREPMVLFYREQQSIKQVAAQLDLSEEVTKQRLARGRKLLKAEMSTLVEDILGQTTPNKVFTAGVLAALPVFSTKAASTAVARAAAKGASTAKFGASSNFLGMLISPILVWWGVINHHKADIEEAKTEKERRFLKRSRIIGLLYCLSLPLAIFLFAFTELRRYGNLIWFLILQYFIGMFILGYSGYKKLKAIQIEQGTYIEPEKRFRSKRRIYAEFSHIFSWILIIGYVPMKANDTFAVCLTITGVMLIYLVLTQLCLNKQQYYYQIASAIIPMVGILALVIYSLRWNKWMQEITKYQKDTFGQIKLLIIITIITGICLNILIMYYQKYRKQINP
ncbi:MAG: sigma-70 family RNA polymerase sigma factor [Sedimentisphaerales bacterium]|nr:sigma-70 family RNA polymerase sigma factor [Sedimentisphaerales bacterium]